MSNPIQPIETRYAGCRFRSRGEARWAVFFNALGVRWEYEPEGFQLPSGWYLPDFRLHGIGGDGSRHPYVWFEVKPENGDSNDPRWPELAQDAPVIVAFGMPPVDGEILNGCPRADGWMEMHESALDPDGDVQFGWDNHRAFCICYTCGRIGITFSGLGDRVCGHGGSEDYYSHDHPRILDAYKAAYSARFEHGEQG